MTRSRTIGKWRSGSTRRPCRVVVAQECVARERRHAVDHHAAAAAHGHAARPAEREAAVEMVLDVLQALQHGRIVAEGHVERLEPRHAIGLRVVAQALHPDGALGGHDHVSATACSAAPP
jgi:hypothetical protein